jgi:uracil phosphoribosyltransferase
MSSSSIPPATSSAAAAPSIGPAIPPNVVRLPATSQLEALLTVIRDQKTARSDFIFYSNRIIRLLVEEGLNHLPVTESTVMTPTGLPYRGEWG